MLLLPVPRYDERLHDALSLHMTDSPVLSRWQTRRDVIIDLLIGLGIPGLGMCMRTCVPLPHRRHSSPSL